MRIWGAGCAAAAPSGIKSYVDKKGKNQSNELLKVPLLYRSPHSDGAVLWLNSGYLQCNKQQREHALLHNGHF